MDEKAKEMLARIETELAALREKLTALEEEVASCRAAAAKTASPAAAPDEPLTDEAPAPVDLSDVVDIPDLPEDVAVEAADEASAASLPEEPEQLPDLPEDLPEETPVPEEVAAQVEEKPVEETPVEAAPKRELRRLSGEYRWQKDRPGAPVRNIRSGISLYDRALFINILFREDYARYDETIAALNACNGLDEAVDYLLGAFPDWNWSGDAVYAFMMSIRKKLG